MTTTHFVDISPLHSFCLHTGSCICHLFDWIHYCPLCWQLLSSQASTRATTTTTLGQIGGESKCRIRGGRKRSQQYVRGAQSSGESRCTGLGGDDFLHCWMGGMIEAAGAQPWMRFLVLYVRMYLWGILSSMVGSINRQRHQVKTSNADYVRMDHAHVVAIEI